MPQFLHSTSRGLAEGPLGGLVPPLSSRLALAEHGRPRLLEGKAKRAGAGAWPRGFESPLHQQPRRDLGLLPFGFISPSLSFPIFPKGPGTVLGRPVYRRHVTHKSVLVNGGWKSSVGYSLNVYSPGTVPGMGAEQ